MPSRKRPAKHVQRKKRSRLQFETFEQRRLLASDFASITGYVFTDDDGTAGFSAGDTRFPGVTVRITDLGTSGSSDILTDAQGEYRVDNLSASTYTIEQLAPGPAGGFIPVAGSSPQTIVITAADADTQLGGGTVGTSIDSFAGTFQTVTADPLGVNPATSSVADTVAIGGERDILVEEFSGSGSITVETNNFIQFPDGALSFNPDIVGFGEFTVSYDGFDSDASSLEPTGLGGIDLTNGGLATVVQLRLAADNPALTDSVSLRFYTDGSNFSEFQFAIPNLSGGSGIDTLGEVLVPFSSAPTVTAGAGADFTNIGAIELVGGFSSAGGIDAQFAQFQTLGPQVFIADFENELAVPGIEIQKATNGQDADVAPGVLLAVGDSATFTYGVTNTGNTEFDSVSVIDDNGTPGDALDDFNALFISGDTDGNLLLSPGETWLFDTTNTRVVTAGQYTNIATVTANPVDALGTDISSLADETAMDSSNHFGFTAQVVIETATNGQDADTAPGASLTVGTTATFTYALTNPGNIELGNISLTDDNGTSADTLDDFSPTFIGGDTDGDSRLDVGETWTYESTRVVTSGQFTNVATVDAVPVDSTGLSVGGSVFASDPSNHIGVDTIDLSVSLVDSADPVSAGDSLTYTVVVSNNGLSDASDTDLSVTLPTEFSVDTTNGSSSFGITVIGQSVTAAIGTLAAGQTASVTISGTVSPDASGSILASATVVAFETESDLGNNTATEDTTVSNSAPVANDDTLSVTEDVVFDGLLADLLANDSDPDATGTLSVIAISSASGRAQLVGTDGFQYSPAADEFGTAADEFTYTIEDGGGLTSTGTVTIDIAPVNDPPVFVADSAFTLQGESLTINGNATQNDSGGPSNENDSVSITSVTSTTPGGGTAVLEAGAITYSPAQGFSGTDTVSYTISDSSGATASATATINISALGGFELGAATGIGTGSFVGSVAEGDVDGDGDTDLFVANQYQDSSDRISSITVLVNDGQGNFFDSFQLGLEGHERPLGIVVEDFNGDSRDDIAIAVFGATPSEGGILVNLNTGSGYSSSSWSSVASGLGPSAIAAEDIDDDGAIDLAFTNYAGNTVSILHGNGSGGFSAGQSIAVGSRPSAIVFGDIESDSAPDFAVASFGDDSVSVYVGDGNGGFTLGGRQDGIVDPRGLAVGNFDGNGYDDLAVTASGNVQIFLNDGDFSTIDISPQIVSLDNIVAGIQSYDVNVDGFDDLIIANSQGQAVTVMESSNGAFTRAANFSVANDQIGPNNAPMSIAIGDFNGDQVIDVASALSLRGVTIQYGNRINGGTTPETLDELVDFPFTIFDAGGNEVLDAAGNQIRPVTVGDELILLVSVDDLRADTFSVDTGVFAAYLDVLYSSDLVSVLPADVGQASTLDFNIAFGQFYTNVQRGDATTPGLIDEVGAVQTSFQPLGTQIRELLAIRFRADAPGIATFAGDPSEIEDTILFQPPEVVAVSQIGFDLQQVTISAGDAGAGEFHNAENPGDVNGDGNVSSIDALMIINQINASGGVVTLSASGAEGERRSMPDVNNDGRVSPTDALRILNELNSQIYQGIVSAESLASVDLETSDDTDSIFAELGAAVPVGLPTPSASQAATVDWSVLAETDEQDEDEAVEQIALDITLRVS